jgi:Holliday junction resolvase
MGSVKKALEFQQNAGAAESIAVRFVTKSLNVAVHIGISAMVN